MIAPGQLTANRHRRPNSQASRRTPHYNVARSKANLDRVGQQMLESCASGHQQQLFTSLLVLIQSELEGFEQKKGMDSFICAPPARAPLLKP